MTHWSRRSTFVNHLAVAQKAAGEAFCKCRHVWASRLKTVWCLRRILGRVVASVASFDSCSSSSAAGVAGMWDQTRADLRRWIWESEFIGWVWGACRDLGRRRCLHGGTRCSFDAATVCLGSFTFYMVNKSFVNLPLSLFIKSVFGLCLCDHSGSTWKASCLN